MNTENAAEKSKSIREEVKELFGLSWDRFVEWVVIAWLSLWSWGGLAESNGYMPKQLPLEWTRTGLESLSVAVPTWFSDIPVWLSSPSRSWLAIGFILLAVASQTCSLRRFQNTGLRVVALLALVAAIEAQQQYWPLFHFIWIAAIPAAIAVARGFMPDQRKVDPLTESFYYHGGVVSKFVGSVLSLLVLPVLAPFVLIGSLVSSYKVEVTREPAVEALQQVTWELHNKGTALKDLDALTFLSALLPVLALNKGWAGRRIAWHLQWALGGPRGARPVRSQR
ncbi:hypothetical protein ACIPY3_15570 [Paenarthrobacter sp. NPDC089714]|uniref:hypothetical protein n=1 Tax=Paenarthrobacter sp. NPDC089714 TaxID=3364377 RepID=UPI0038005D89